MFARSKFTLDINKDFPLDRNVAVSAIGSKFVYQSGAKLIVSA